MEVFAFMASTERTETPTLEDFALATEGTCIGERALSEALRFVECMSKELRLNGVSAGQVVDAITAGERAAREATPCPCRECSKRHAMAREERASNGGVP